MNDEKAASSSSTRSVLTAGAIWLVLTVLAELLLVSINFQPPGVTREARISDDAFEFLMYLSAPVFVMVLVMIGYSAINHRAGDDPDEDGSPIRNQKTFTWTWLAISSALAILVIITPGFTGLDELRAEPDADIVIQVRGERWNWNFTYKESGVQTQGTLNIPVDTRVKFEITSTDVIHSFWVPAFRIKMDAVPGIVTETMVTAEEIGNFTDDVNLRVQCAELCGVGHARMWTEVEVMSRADFDTWLAGAGG